MEDTDNAEEEGVSSSLDRVIRDGFWEEAVVSGKRQDPFPAHPGLFLLLSNHLSVGRWWWGWGSGEFRVLFLERRAGVRLAGLRAEPLSFPSLSLHQVCPRHTLPSPPSLESLQKHGHMMSWHHWDTPAFILFLNHVFVPCVCIVPGTALDREQGSEEGLSSCPCTAHS